MRLTNTATEREQWRRLSNDDNSDMSALLTISNGRDNDGGQLQLLKVPRSRSRRARSVGGCDDGLWYNNDGGGDDDESSMSQQHTTCSLSVKSTVIGGRSTAKRWSVTSSCATLTGSHVRDHFAAFFQVSDNKLAMKLFGNRLSLEKEKRRHLAVGHWVIHPCSSFR